MHGKDTHFKIIDDLHPDIHVGKRPLHCSVTRLLQAGVWSRYTYSRNVWAYPPASDPLAIDDMAKWRISDFEYLVAEYISKEVVIPPPPDPKFDCSKNR